MGGCQASFVEGSEADEMPGDAFRPSRSCKETCFSTYLDNNFDLICLIIKFLDAASIRNVKHTKLFDFCAGALEDRLNFLDILYEQKYSQYAVAYPKANPFVTSCTLGKLDDVRFFCENFPLGQNSDKFAKFINQKGRTHEGFPGYTGLISATRKEHFHVVKYLLQFKSIKLTMDKDGWNCLHLACVSKESTSIAKLILQHPKCSLSGVINAVNCNGEETPLDLAFYNTNTVQMIEVIHLLLAHGAKRSRDLSRKQKQKNVHTSKSNVP